MTPSAPPPGPRRSVRWGLFLAIILTVLLLPVALLGAGVFHALRVSRDTGILRNSVLASARGQWDKTVEIRTGSVIWSLARVGLALVDVPVEARTALRAIRGAEVGVYRLRDPARMPDYAAMLTRTDQAMTGRGWSRLVGVLERDQLVAIYVPERGSSPRNLKVCLVVLNQRDMVVASARSNLEPLLDLVQSHSGWPRPGTRATRL